MEKTIDRIKLPINDKLAITLDTLASSMDCGKATAAKIGNAAGARIQVGRRVLFSVPKVQRYLEQLSSESETVASGQ